LLQPFASLIAVSVCAASVPHEPDIAAMDLFVVPTIGFDLLYAFVIIRLDHRDLVWIGVTRRRNGLHARSQKHSRGMKRRATYNRVRTHRSLDKDAPVSRPVQRTGVIGSRAILGGLHHRCAGV
jgi:hypothetical protein